MKKTASFTQNSQYKILKRSWQSSQFYQTKFSNYLLFLRYSPIIDSHFSYSSLPSKFNQLRRSWPDVLQHLHLHLPLIRHPHRKPNLRVTTPLRVASFSALSPHPSDFRPQTSSIIRCHHITLVFSCFYDSNTSRDFSKGLITTANILNYLNIALFLNNVLQK